jgi:hypothetical protein
VSARRWAQGAALATLAALAAGAGCRGMVERQIRVLAIGHDLAHDAAAREGGQLHPAAVEAIVYHPALPYAFNGFGGHAPGDGLLDAAALTPRINAALRGSVAAQLVGGGCVVVLQVSPRAGTVTAVWSAPTPLWPTTRQAVLFDLRRVPGAFDPAAALTTAEVQAAMAVRVEAP